MDKLYKYKTMLLEHVNCDLCGSDDYVVRYRKPDSWLWVNQFEYPVVECTNCSLVYVNPRPIFEHMGKFYPDGYHNDRDDELHLVRYKHQFEYISALKVKKVLDIGCARGDWLSFIHKRWPSVELYGVDAFSDRVINNYINFQKGQLHEVELPESSFDLITAWAVIEHIHTPSEYFRTVFKLLKPGGKFVFLVTNSESVYGKYAYKEDVPRHLYHFNKKSLDGYADKYGLEINKIQCDERFWDGSGRGAIRFAIAKVLGITWRDIKKNDYNLFRKVLLKAASIFDVLFFKYKWEKEIGRSGIIVVTMTKP